MPRDVAFCQSWLQHLDLRKAWRSAGYSLNNKGWSTRAHRKLKRFSKYLQPLQEAKAKQVGAQLGVKQGDLLQTMRDIGFYNAKDYCEVTDEPLMCDAEDEEGNVKRKQVNLYGEPVFRVRLKRFTELTSEQAVAVELKLDGDEVVGYYLPNQKVRHKYLESLGKNLGLFLPEVAKEAHAHLHRHAHLHFDDVPTDKLEKMQRELIVMVGPVQARNLGISQAEIDDALRIYGDQESNTKGAP